MLFRENKTICVKFDSKFFFLIINKCGDKCILIPKPAVLVLSFFLVKLRNVRIHIQLYGAVFLSEVMSRKKTSFVKIDPTCVSTTNQQS